MKPTLRLTFALMIIFAGFNRCEKGPDEIGQKIMHPDDSVAAKYDTTFEMKTQLVRTDSFSTLYHFFDQRSFINSYSDLLIGGFEGPHFGKFKASFISQINKSDSINFAGDTLVAVGADLYFKVKERYGQVSNAEFNIYKINTDLTINNPYYSTTDPGAFYSEQDLISESAEILGDSLIKITLTQEFAEFLASADDTTMASQSDFRAFFPGIYAEMEYQDQGFLNKIALTNDTTKMELAYKKEGSSEEPDTLEYPIASSSIRFNTYDHNYEAATDPDINVNQFLKNDTAVSDSILLVDGLAGTRVKFSIPGEVREKFQKDSNFLARAEVQLSPYRQYKDFLFPQEVGMYTYTNDTNYVNISNNTFFDGSYRKDPNYYSCNITSYIQAYINGDVGNEFYLHTKNYQTEPGHLILRGTGKKTAVRLRIRYYKP